MSSSFSCSLCDPEKQGPTVSDSSPEVLRIWRRLPELPRRSRPEDRVPADGGAAAALHLPALVSGAHGLARSARSPPRRCSDRWCTPLSSPLSRQGWQQSPQSRFRPERRNRLYWCMTPVHKYTEFNWGLCSPLQVYHSLSRRTVKKLPFQPRNCSHFFLKCKPCCWKVL